MNLDKNNTLGFNFYIFIVSLQTQCESFKTTCLEVSIQIEFGRKVWYILGEQVAGIVSKIKQ